MAGGGYHPPPMRVVLCTVPDRDTGLRLARELVEARLAACVNVVAGLTSVYRWQGEIVEEGEALMIVKTSAERYEAFERALAASHPYSVPEIVALEPTAVNRPYREWVEGETTGAG